MNLKYLLPLEETGICISKPYEADRLRMAKRTHKETYLITQLKEEKFPLKYCCHHTRTELWKRSVT